MLRPITPFIEYLVNYDYISNILCINKDKPNCNGKCHIVKQLKQQQEDDFNALHIQLEEYPIGFVFFLSLSIIDKSLIF